MLKTSRWSPRFAGGKDVFTHLRINTLTHLYTHNETEEQRRSPEIEQGAEKESGRDRKIQRSAI